MFRLALVERAFPAHSPKPRPDHFRPTDTEKQLAQERNEPPLVSVFDVARTTVLEAQSFRMRPAPTVAFKVYVPDILRLALPDGSGYLCVVRDPLPELAGQPGGDGHCGIEGLGRPKGAPKAVYKALRSRLCDLAELHG